MKYLNLIAILFISLFLCACGTTTPSAADLYKGQTESQIFHDGQKAVVKGDYDEAVKHFEALDAQYPFGEYSRQSQLEVIYAYYKKDDVPSALIAADRYIRLYPRGPNVDYAYYLRGLIRFEENQGFFEKYFPVDMAKRDTTSLKQAYTDFRLLTHYFPNSKYVPDAQKRMAYIRNTLASHELQVAQFYYDREAYVAAANRANEVVKHYQQSPSVPGALALMVKSYRKLNLTADANESLRVLQINYPEASRGL